MRVHDITVSADLTTEDLKRISLNAARFRSDISLKVREATIDVKSLLGMMMFPLKKGTVVTVQTKGNDEEEALDYMCENMEH